MYVSFSAGKSVIRSTTQYNVLSAITVNGYVGELCVSAGLSSAHFVVPAHLLTVQPARTGIQERPPRVLTVDYILVTISRALIFFLYYSRNCI